MKTICMALLAGMVGCAFGQPVAAAEPARFTEKVLYSFCSQLNCTDGLGPVAGLIVANGILYGTTEGGGNGVPAGGTVFALNPSTGAENVLYSFFCSKQNCTDGASPEAALIDVKGTLYSTTTYGGAFGDGTLFSLDPASGTETVLHSFAGGSDGQNPVAGLIHNRGELYGTTLYGTAFAFNMAKGAERVLYSFCSQTNCTDGGKPAADVIDVNGLLYGTTSTGGADFSGCGEVGCGVVFSVDPKAGTETVLHSFGYGTDGGTPLAGLINVNGTYYGTTSGSPGESCGNISFGCGTVFSFDPNTGTEKVIYTFQGGSDGAVPVAGLIDVNGTLYGTTLNGGGKGCTNFGPGCGTVFSIDPTTGTEKVVYSFQGGSDGAYPLARLIDVKGALYGTTIEGGGTGCGGKGCGTVFALTKR